MKAKENVHEGHRERMLSKLFESGDKFYEHETLEVLLYYVIPRIDTNPLAHRLIARFGSLDKVLSASKEELLSVDGVGEKTANFLRAIDLVRNKAQESKNNPPKLSNFYQTKTAVKDLFEGANVEQLYAFLLDKNHVLTATLEFSDANTSKVSAGVADLSKAIAIHKPHFLIVAHNHLSGKVTPSVDDDIATKKINLLCEVHGVSLIDHVIYSKGEFFSYFNSQRLDFVKKDADINKLLNDVNKE